MTMFSLQCVFISTDDDTIYLY